MRRKARRALRHGCTGSGKANQTQYCHRQRFHLRVHEYYSRIVREGVVP